MEKTLKIWCGIIFAVSLLVALFAILALGGGGMRGIGVHGDSFSRSVGVFFVIIFGVPVLSFLSMLWPRFAWALMPFFLVGSFMVFISPVFGLLSLLLFFGTGVLAGLTWEEKRESINV